MTPALAEDAAAVTTSSGLAAATSTREGYARVFLDCPTCDPDFFKTEVGFVDFVRAREDAEVHVLVTTQTTGSGGSEYTLAFLGRSRFLGVDDTMKFVSPANASADEKRTGLVRVFELGLMRYVSHTPAAKELTLAFTAPDATVGKKIDPWNSWTFRVSGRGTFEGQATTSVRDLSGNASATRTTDEWKVRLSASDSYGENRYKFDGPPVTRYVSISRSSSGNGEVVRSLGDHWAAAVNSGLSSSTYSNERLSVAASAGIEYDVFPYSESTRRLLTFRYQLTEGYQRFFDTTIYGRTWQYQPSESLDATTELTQPWGSVSFGLAGSHYFLKDGGGLDLRKNEITGDLSLDLKLFKGFSVTMFGSAALLHDQIYLPSGGASEAEVLLQRKQLETNYTYFTSIGLSYTFGSIYSTVVNPRFGGAGGNRVFFF